MVYRNIPTFNRHHDLWHGGRTPEYFVRHTRRLATFLRDLRPPVLDLGEENPKVQILGEECGFQYTSMGDIDFDEQPIPGRWGTILCLEVLEHLFNPLLALQNMRRALDPGGSIYVTTPGRPHYLWPDQHYHEIDDKRIGWLFARADLLVVRNARIPLRRNLAWHLRGPRPVLRWFVDATRAYELRPATDSAGNSAGGI